MEAIGNFFFNASAFIAVLTIIVFIHEFGHYYIAKISGVKIEEFSIGFGKELFGWHDRHGTRWKVCLLPFGGYVKMFGDVDPASVPDTEKIKQFTEEEAKVAFHTKPLYIKSAIVFAGPLFNFLLAIIIMTFFFFTNGKPVTTSQISFVAEGSAAAEAGMKEGDIITEIDGSKIDSFDDIQRIISINTGSPLDLKYQRGDKILSSRVTPKFMERKDLFGNDIKAPVLGISSKTVRHEELNILSSFTNSVAETYHISASTLKAIGQMISGQRSIKEVSGPLGIAKYSGQSAQQGIKTVMWFIVILSINLGLVNLFPIPLLDGGHLLYYAVEAVRGKPIADKVQQIGFKIGVALIGTFFIFALFNDVRKLNLF